MSETYSLLYPLKSDDIPPNWKSLPIGEVILDSKYGTNVPSVPDGNIFIVGMKDIHEGVVKTDDLLRVKLSGDEQKHFLLKGGDILINRTNSYDLAGC